MKLKTKTIADSLSPSLKAFKPTSLEFEHFCDGIKSYLERIDNSESEENLKTHLMDVFKLLYAPKYTVEQQERIDFVVRIGNRNSSAGVIVETKREMNKADMISAMDVNRKAMHEIVLHYMRERANGNTNIRSVVICTEHQFYVFEAKQFERTFYGNHEFRKDFESWALGQKSDSTTDFFYSQIAKPFIASQDVDLEATYFEIRVLQADANIEHALLPIFKFIGPHTLLGEPLQNDSNSLNKGFYDELLHIIGLEERKQRGQRIIDRPKKEKRNAGSLMENIISKLRFQDDFTSPEIISIYGTNTSEREFSIALELSLTWVNRLLFLKLLEAQICKFHADDQRFKFLKTSVVRDYSELADLFFLVLAYKSSERPAAVEERFGRIPYLNSSLFEKTRLEHLLGIEHLNSTYLLPLFSRTVLKDPQGRRRSGALSPLEYIFEFLDAYDFGTVGSRAVREESKTIINAAVLGLIFEKINGYSEGAIYTPGYITMFMSRKVVRKTVLERFSQEFPEWKLKDVDDLRNNIRDRSKDNILKLNAVIDGIKICDPAVGSGHFLVSCLNEIVALKSYLGILADGAGNCLTGFSVEVDNDELIILNAETNEPFAYRVWNGSVPKNIQKVQETLFEEKQKLIENCLFGVDINRNSVQICRLRLWIELLKNAYYKDTGTRDLETLPNIDINIKHGNALLSRFKLDQNLSDAFNKADLTVTQYRNIVSNYKETRDRTKKKELLEKINKAKSRFQKEALGNLAKKIDADIARLKAEEAQADLFVFGDDEKKAQLHKLSELRSQIDASEKRKEKLLRDEVFLAALEWRFEFPEVLDDKSQFVGFDIVIANPPYMRLQEVEATQQLQREYYERDFSTAKGSYDLANLFFELAARISKKVTDNNIFIFPHKVFNSANGAALREYLLNTRALKHLTHFGANQIFDGVITYTCIALFNSKTCDSFRFTRFRLGADFISEMADEQLYSDIRYDDLSDASRLYGSNQWIFFDSHAGFQVFKKLFADARPLVEKLSVFVGLQTSRDSLYVSRKISETDQFYTILVNPDNKEDEVPVASREFEVEKEFFKPFLLGKDVHRYETLETDRLVFFPYRKKEEVSLVSQDELKNDFPFTYAFVKFYENAFSKRENGKASDLVEWYAYIYPKNLSKFDQHKLISMEICSTEPNVTLDTNGIYHATTLYSLTALEGTEESYEYFLGILNSRLFWWFLKSTGDTLQGDARRMKTNYINPFPLPRSPSSEAQRKIVQKVKKLVHAKAQSQSQSIINGLESGINAAVYALYDLDEADIAVVEKALDATMPFHEVARA